MRDDVAGTVNFPETMIAGLGTCSVSVDYHCLATVCCADSAFPGNGQDSQNQK